MSAEPEDVAKVKRDRCPFCGAKEVRRMSGPSGLTILFACQNVFFNGELDGIDSKRRPQCYETQLAALRSLVREMGTMLTDYETYVAGKFDLGKLINRPEVKAIMEGK